MGGGQQLKAKLNSLELQHFYILLLTMYLTLFLKKVLIQRRPNSQYCIVKYNEGLKTKTFLFVDFSVFFVCLFFELSLRFFCMFCFLLFFDQCFVPPNES